jgi:hypothetical protein
MSNKVKETLDALGIKTTHEQRVMLDEEIGSLTHKNCDEGINEIDNFTLLKIVNKVKRKRKRKKENNQEEFTTVKCE